MAGEILVLEQRGGAIDGEGENWVVVFLYEIDPVVMDFGDNPVALTPLDEWQAAVPRDAVVDYITAGERAKLDTGELAFEILSRSRPRGLSGASFVAQLRARYERKKDEFVTRQTRKWSQAGRRLDA